MTNTQHPHRNKQEHSLPWFWPMAAAVDPFSGSSVAAIRKRDVEAIADLCKLPGVERVAASVAVSGGC